MVSISRILGIILLLIAILLFSVINIASVAIPPFGGSTETQTDSVPVGAFLEDVVFVGRVPEHPIFPFFTSVKAIFILQSNSPYTCDVILTYESDSVPEAQEIGGIHSYDEQGGDKQISITTMISPAAASEPFIIRLKLTNTGSNAITVSTRMIFVVYSFFGLLVPVFLMLIGVITTAVSFVIGKKSSPKTKKRATPGGWEPTLQWSGGSGASKSKNSSSKKRPKMAISSAKGKSSKKTKIVKRSVPQGGAQVGCKFCGKQVAQSAFFCPHCYGKLR